jgi:nicotinamidase-related amidase
MSPHPNICTAESSLLLIVDIQASLTAAMPQSTAENMLTSSIRLVKSADFLKIPILLTEQYPRGLGSTDAKLASLLPKTTRNFEKTGFSCCTASGFDNALENSQRKQIILAGMEAHVCILQTALELLARDYQVYVVEDAVCSRKAEHKSWALHRMQQLGITISNHESVLFEWLKDARHPDFRAISNMLR